MFKRSSFTEPLDEIRRKSYLRACKLRESGVLSDPRLETCPHYVSIDSNWSFLDCQAIIFCKQIARNYSMVQFQILFVIIWNKYLMFYSAATKYSCTNSTSIVSFVVVVLNFVSYNAQWLGGARTCALRIPNPERYWLSYHAIIFC